MAFRFHHILFWRAAMHGFQFIDHNVGDTWSQHLCPFMSIFLVIDRHPDQGRGAGLVTLLACLRIRVLGWLFYELLVLLTSHVLVHSYVCVCTTRRTTMVCRLPMWLHAMAMSRQCACWQRTMQISIRWFVSFCCMNDGNRHETDGCDADTHSHALAHMWSGLYAFE